MYARLLLCVTVAVCVNAQALPPLSQRICTALDGIIENPTTLGGKSPEHVQKVAKLAKKLFHGLKLDRAVDNDVAQQGGAQGIVSKLSGRLNANKKKLFFNVSRKYTHGQEDSLEECCDAVQSNLDKKVVNNVVHDTVPSGPQTVVNGPQFNNGHIDHQTNTYNYNKLRSAKKKLFYNKNTYTQVNNHYNKLSGKARNTDKRKLGLLIGIDTDTSAYDYRHREINVNNYYGPDNGGRVNGQTYDHANIAQQENIFNYFNHKLRSFSAPVKKLSMQVPNKQKDEAFQMLAYVASQETLKEATLNGPSGPTLDKESLKPPAPLTLSGDGYKQVKKLCMVSPGSNNYCVQQMKGL